MSELVFVIGYRENVIDKISLNLLFLSLKLNFNIELHEQNENPASLTLSFFCCILELSQKVPILGIVSILKTKKK
ncbi:hypothetical protein BLOT_002167 [Blomia tropicalis]|nr:hypothetical protein BLOT_002167 [Blomia tropicalis]